VAAAIAKGEPAVSNRQILYSSKMACQASMRLGLLGPLSGRMLNNLALLERHTSDRLGTLDQSGNEYHGATVVARLEPTGRVT
jgi:hypothetical protein